MKLFQAVVFQSFIICILQSGNSIQRDLQIKLQISASVFSMDDIKYAVSVLIFSKTDFYTWKATEPRREACVSRLSEVIQLSVPYPSRRPASIFKSGQIGIKEFVYFIQYNVLPYETQYKKSNEVFIVSSTSYPYLTVPRNIIFRYSFLDFFCCIV